MSSGGFEVKGARAPSVLSSHRPKSSTKNGYHILAHTSSVDELLFSSQHPSRLNDPIINFKAPWDHPKPQPPFHTFGTVQEKIETRNKVRGPPLLWCPAPGSATHTREKTKTRSSVDDAGYLWSTRGHFRHLKHKPTFVDETLFGPRLEEPSFKAPWDVKKNSEMKHSNYCNVDVVDNKEALTHGALSDFRRTSISRPESARGVSGHPEPQNHGAKVVKPVWKP
ncbi:unnamed protein product [Candidula unifasciata]|uniref:RBPJ-interacting and tubulin-associated protein 1 n=1 Tax=Candidula unifasciata TaxID=100452 RepID=A0A8S3ZFZ8_9EUPU|nr:unnamed protein product [Candidula unifasciata]